MSYQFYLAGTLMPITPSKLKLKINNNNETVNLINEGDVNILKKAGLTEISFTVLLPNRDYPFSKGSRSSTYLALFENLKVSREPFAFTVSRQKSYGTSMLVSMETYTINEDAESYGFDVSVDITLKQYRAYGTRNVRIANQIAAAEALRAASADNKPAGSTYTVKDGDNLVAIAKTYYNDSESWRDIYSANAETIGSNPNNLTAGQVLTMP